MSPRRPPTSTSGPRTPPSTELRCWCGHDPARFDEFARRYRAELAQAPAAPAVGPLVARARRRRLVLLTATADVGRSGAAVVQAAVVQAAVVQAAVVQAASHGCVSVHRVGRRVE